MAFIPQLIDKEDTFIANSLISITATSAAIFGIAFGGSAGIIGLDNIFYIDSTTFFLSALAIFTINVKEKTRFIPKDILNIGKDAIGTVRESFMHELKEGLAYIFTSHETRYAFRTFFFLLSYVGAISTVYITYIQSVLSSTPGNVLNVAFTALALAVGVFIGSLFYGRIAHKFSIKKVINIAMLIGSGFLIFFIFSIRIYPRTLYAIFLSSVLGVIISPVFIGVNSLIHSESEKKMLGRVFSSLEFTAHIGFLVAMFTFAALAKMFSSFTVMVSIGIIGFLFSLIFTFIDDTR
jgi:hypothetical protein